MAYKKKINGNKKFGKDSYLADDRNYELFAEQLAKLGMELRDVTGDGNCFFRALSDQLNGNESEHIKYRREVCKYMRENRNEFEPFVAALVDDYEDSEKVDRRANKKIDSFDRYINNLEQLGTYADNGCLVAFARLYQLDINIHQLNLPIWTIRGEASGKRDRQINLSYHNAEHYSSVRKLGDGSNAPSFINLNINDHNSNNNVSSNKNKKPLSNQNNYSLATSSSSKQNYSDNNNNISSKPSSAVKNNHQLSKSSVSKSNYDKENSSSRKTSASIYDYNGDFDEKELNDNVDRIMNITRCFDLNLIKKELMSNANDFEMALESVMNKMNKSSLNNPNDFDDNTNNNEEENDDNNNSNNSLSKNNNKPKVDRKADKKIRQMEKQKIKVLEQREKEMLTKQAALQTKRINSSQIIDQHEIEQRHSSAASQKLDLNNLSVETKFI